MKLFENPDFAAAITAASAYFKQQGIILSEQIIEKDYYVTEALRLLAQNYGEQVIFKGGTSLSKGWNLIQRFSEDIDIFLDPQTFKPPLVTRGIDRELKRMRDIVGSHPGLSYQEGRGQTVGGFGRGDYFAYTPRFGGVGAIASIVFMEAATASGRQPTEDVSLQSYVARFLQETNASLQAEDEEKFVMRLLHFRRTFVEKMFAIHSKIELYKANKQPLGSYARHYYDLYQLAQHESVKAMLISDEYGAIKEDYERVSKEAFPRSYFRPDDFRFANSDALYPTGELRTMIAREFAIQCENLCFGLYPSWDEVELLLAELKPNL